MFNHYNKLKDVYLSCRFNSSVDLIKQVSRIISSGNPYCRLIESHLETVCKVCFISDFEMVLLQKVATPFFLKFDNQLQSEDIKLALMCFSIAIKEDFKNYQPGKNKSIKVLIHIIQADHFEAFRGYYELFKQIPLGNGCSI